MLILWPTSLQSVVDCRCFSWSSVSSCTFSSGKRSEAVWSLDFYLSKVIFLTHTNLLHRKGKASEATKILMNLFVAMLILNLSFLTNESISNLGIKGACVAIAAALHYGMLATFTWFFMQALHLYLSLRRICTEVKHYMLKIYVTGWGKRPEPKMILVLS